jgi:hypothetical protein
MQIDGEILDDRRALGLGPFKIGVAQKIRRQDLRAIGGRGLRLLVHAAGFLWSTQATQSEPNAKALFPRG